MRKTHEQVTCAVAAMSDSQLHMYRQLHSLPKYESLFNRDLAIWEGNNWALPSDRDVSHVYAMACLYNHACCPNCELVEHPPRSCSVVVRLLRPVNKGEQLLVSYFDPDLKPEDHNKELILWEFACECYNDIVVRI